MLYLNPKKLFNDKLRIAIYKYKYYISVLFIRVYIVFVSFHESNDCNLWCVSEKVISTILFVTYSYKTQSENSVIKIRSAAIKP